MNDTDRGLTEQRTINDNVAAPRFCPNFLHRLSTSQPLHQHHHRPTPVTNRHRNPSHLWDGTPSAPLLAIIKTSSTLNRFALVWIAAIGVHSSRCRKRPSSLPDPSGTTARTVILSTIPTKAATMVSSSASSSLLSRTLTCCLSAGACQKVRPRPSKIRFGRIILPIADTDIWDRLPSWGMLQTRRSLQAHGQT